MADGPEQDLPDRTTAASDGGDHAAAGDGSDPAPGGDGGDPAAASDAVDGPSGEGARPRGLNARVRAVRANLRERETFLILCGQVIVLYMGHGLIVPVLPLYARTFGVDVTMVGLLLSMQAFPRIFANVPSGRLSDRHGPHRVLLAAAIIASVAALASGLAGSYWFLVGARVLHGIGTAASHTAGLTYTAHVSTPENRGRHIAAFQGSFLIGVGVGPVIGGFTAQLFGLRAPFFVYMVMALATAVWIRTRLPDPREDRPEGALDGEDRDEEEPSSGRAAVSALSESGTVRLVFNAVVLLACSFGLVAAYTRTGTRDFGIVLVAEESGLLAGAIGGLMSLIVLANLCVLYAAGRATDRYGVTQVIAGSWLLTVVALVMLSYSTSFRMMAAAAVVYGLAAGMGTPAPAIYISNSMPKERLGAALGVYRTANDIGLIVGPIAMGALTAVWGVRFGLQVNAVLVAFATVAFLVYQGTRPRPSRGSDDRGSRVR